MSNDEKSANQFISALVKNLQAVCHGHVEFNKNVKVVGHLYLTVDNCNSEFNYIVNEKVSKSDEASTTFISKSFYATDPQQKTPKKNIDRPLPPPTPNVLGKTRYDISVDLTDDHTQGTMGGGRYPQVSQRNQFSRPQGGFPRPPQMRRRPFDQNRLAPHQMAKMPRLSSPQRHPINFPSTLPRKIPQSPHRIPSIITSPIKPSIPSDLQTVTSIPPESVSATPAQSLPGADQPETDSSVSSDKPDIKFEIIKVENGSVVASSNKSSTDGEDGELRIESVISHDLSCVPDTSSPEKDSDIKNSESSESDKPSSDPAPETDPSEMITSENTPSKTPPSNNPDVIEIDIDLTKVKDEDDSLLDSSCVFNMPSSSFQHQTYGGQGDNSMSSFGGESNDDDFFASLREQTVGLYPVGLHINESDQNFSDIPNLPGVTAQNQGAAYLPVAGTSSSLSSNNQQTMKNVKCPYCPKTYTTKNILSRHIRENHSDHKFKCVLCGADFTRQVTLRNHIIRLHNTSISSLNIPDLN